MRAVAACVRARLRGDLRSTVLFVLLTALAGAVLLSGVAGARRTESAYRRMLDASGAGHALVFSPGLDADAVRRLPEVDELGRFFYVFARFPTLEGDGTSIVPFVAADPALYRTLDRPRVLEGRLFDPDRPDEVIVSEGVADRYGVGVGDVLPVRLLTLDEALGGLGAGADEVEPTGPAVDLRVAGVTRSSQDVGRSYEDAGVEYSGSHENMSLTPAFFRENVEPSFGSDDLAMRVRLRRGEADVPAFLAGLRRVNGDTPVEPELQADVTARIERSTDVLATALLVFGSAAGLFGLLLVGQALARQGRHDLADAETLQALGMRPGAVAAIGVGRALVVGVLGSATAVALAVLASPLFPVGLARQAEPSPGIDADGPVLLAGAVFAVVVLAVPVGAAVWWRLHRGETAETVRRPGGLGLPDRLAGAGLPVVGTTGVRFALDRGRGTRSVPLRTTIAGAAVGLAALSAVLVFGQSLGRLVDDPVRQGWNWDVVVGNPNEQLPNEGAEAALAREPAVDGFTTVLAGPVRLGGVGSTVLGLEPVEGDVMPPLLDGRFPAGDDEVALDLKLLRRIGVGVGDTVATSVGRELDVVGEIAFPDAVVDVGEGSEGGAVMTLAGLASFGDATFPTRWLVDLAPGVSVDEARRLLTPAFGRTVLPPVRSDDVENLATVAWMPSALAGLVALFAVMTIGHVLVATIRRRRDLAILKTLGFGRRDVRWVVAWQASTLGLVALAVGLPLGVIAGRWAWIVVAERMGARSAPSIDVLVLGLLVVGSFVALNAIAAVPGRVAARVRPAVALRSE